MFIPDGITSRVDRKWRQIFANRKCDVVAEDEMNDFDVVEVVAVEVVAGGRQKLEASERFAK